MSPEYSCSYFIINERGPKYVFILISLFYNQYQKDHSSSSLKSLEWRYEEGSSSCRSFLIYFCLNLHVFNLVHTHNCNKTIDRFKNYSARRVHNGCLCLFSFACKKLARNCCLCPEHTESIIKYKLYKP